MGEAHLDCVALDRQKYMSLILSIRSGLAICVALLAWAAGSRQGPQGAGDPQAGRRPACRGLPRRQGRGARYEVYRLLANCRVTHGLPAPWCRTRATTRPTRHTTARRTRTGPAAHASDDASAPAHRPAGPGATPPRPG